jgi:hypothetical protein
MRASESLRRGVEKIVLCHFKPYQFFMRLTLITLLLFVLTSSSVCFKNYPIYNNNGIDNFSVTTGGSPWKIYYATGYYMNKLGQVHIKANSSNGQEIDMGIYLDSANPLRTYVIDVDGPNSARATITRVTTFNDVGYTDFHSSNAGGYLKLTKFDLVNGKMSGEFQFITYSAPPGNRYDTFSNGKFNDIDLYNPASTIKSGKITAKLNSKDWWSTSVYGYIQQSPPPMLAVRVDPLEGQRQLLFSIPLNVGTGTFPLKDYDIQNTGLPSVKCSELPVEYFPISGSSFITITSIDLSQRKLTANFSMTLVNSGGQTINFTNGALIVDGWQ